jgi:CheY-like chemotaxis protein
LSSRSITDADRDRGRKLARLRRGFWRCALLSPGAKAASSQLSSDGHGALGVLVVEDEPDVRMVVVDMLEDIGYTVLAAADGASGLKILDSETRIDLLVSDVGLPGGINGRQLADAARQRRLDLKVLFITGYSEFFTAGSGLLDEDMQVITKPFSLTAFADKVQGMVG